MAADLRHSFVPGGQPGRERQRVPAQTEKGRPDGCRAGPETTSPRSGGYGRSMTNMGDVHVSQWAGLDESPSAFSTEILA